MRVRTRGREFEPRDAECVSKLIRCSAFVLGVLCLSSFPLASAEGPANVVESNLSTSRYPCRSDGLSTSMRLNSGVAVLCTDRRDRGWLWLKTNDWEAIWHGLEYPVHPRHPPSQLVDIAAGGKGPSRIIYFLYDGGELFSWLWRSRTNRYQSLREFGCWEVIRKASTSRGDRLIKA